jgi:hypothetical protein
MKLCSAHGTYRYPLGACTHHGGSTMGFLSELRTDERRRPRVAELPNNISGVAYEHLWSTLTPEYPGLTQGRMVRCSCDPYGAFRAGHLAPTAR